MAIDWKRVYKWGSRLLFAGVVAATVAAYVFAPLFRIGVTKEIGSKSAREQLVHQVIADLSRQAGLEETPDVAVSESPSAPFAVRVAFLGSIVAISPRVLDPNAYTDADVRGVIAHEIGHIKMWDSYRIWNHWNSAWHRGKELEADTYASTLVGCEDMHVLIRNHWQEALVGFQDENDPHPHPRERLAATGDCP